MEKMWEQEHEAAPTSLDSSRASPTPSPEWSSRPHLPHPAQAVLESSHEEHEEWEEQQEEDEDDELFRDLMYEDADGWI